MVDRKQLKNTNGLILGTPGSGKSFSEKREICNAFLVTDDDIIIADPVSYTHLRSIIHGIPRGLIFPFGFGISTLFTAFGSYLLHCFWMSFTNLYSGMTANDSIVRPSVPAV